MGTREGNNINVIVAATLGAGIELSRIIAINEYGPFANPQNTFLRTPSGVEGFDYLRFINEAWGTTMTEDEFREMVILHE